MWEAVRGAGIEGVVDVTLAYSTVLAHVDPARASEEVLRAIARAIARAASGAGEGETRVGREVVIPVCYGGEFGPDLEDVARMGGMSAEEAAARHASGRYVVRFIGFAPGFGYLEGLPEGLHAPRLARPRARVAAGSVGIAGAQTGVYPRATAGGWRLIGRTPVVMFDAERAEPSVLGGGDVVRFVSISAREFERMGGSRDSRD